MNMVSNPCSHRYTVEDVRDFHGEFPGSNFLRVGALSSTRYMDANLEIHQLH